MGALRELYGTFIGRWYVTLLGLTFLWRAVRHLGWRRTGLYAAVALVVGIAAENASVHFGIPYTAYVFNPALRGREVFVGSVPLMVPLSYTYMGYFGFAAGRLLASGPGHTRARRPWQEYLLGLVLTVWAVWLMDPVSRLGRRWFLGDVFHYRGPGFWFGLPLGSQVGFTGTAAVLVGVLCWLTRDEPDRPVTRVVDHPHLTALVTYGAQLLWLSVVAVVLGADEIGGATLLIAVPAVALTAVAWSNLRARWPGAAPSVPPDSDRQPAAGAPGEVAPAAAASASVAEAAVPVPVAEGVGP